MTTHCSRLVLLISLFLLAGCPPAFAEERASLAVGVGGDAPTPIVLAEGWSIGKWFSGSGGRTRVVQFCVLTMCIALFIMMRKLN